MSTITYVDKDESAFMRFLGFLLRPVSPAFLTDYWTTIGMTVYYPGRRVKNPFLPQYAGIRAHERMHVDQFIKFGLGCPKFGVVVLFFVYVLFPLPVFFSGRWLLERGPYLSDIKRGSRDVESSVLTLWGGYGMPWPKTLMRSWFLKNLKTGESNGN